MSIFKEINESAEDPIVESDDTDKIVGGMGRTGVLKEFYRLTETQLLTEDDRAKRIKQIEKERKELKKSEVTWQDVEDGKAENKEYRAWRRKDKKLSDENISLTVTMQREEREADHAKRKGTSTDPKIQQLADKLHDLTCHWDHTERCGYHYGNWKDDVRSEMLDSYGDVKRLIKKFGEDGFTERLDIVGKAKQAEKDLTS